MKAAKDASLVRTQTAILMPWHGHWNRSEIICTFRTSADLKESIGTALLLYLIQLFGKKTLLIDLN